MVAETADLSQVLLFMSLMRGIWVQFAFRIGSTTGRFGPRRSRRLDRVSAGVERNGWVCVLSSPSTIVCLSFSSGLWYRGRA
eukprot:6173036-Pleurochrysis_carterae.AAC.1